MIKERLSLKMDIFFSFIFDINTHPIDTIINTFDLIASNENLVKYNCPLNRLNIELGNIDKDFEDELNTIFLNIQKKILILLDTASKNNLITPTNNDSLSEFIITSTWGALSLSYNNSSKDRFINNISHIKHYLNSLKNQLDHSV